MHTPHAEESLLDDLRTLGVAAGDVLWVHCSFKSLGTVEGGAATVVAALEGAIGPQGLLLMPSFNLIEGGNEARAENWRIETSPSTVGWVTEYFRRMPGTFRSDHYSHSVAARGPGAAEFVAGHRAKEGFVSPWDLEPWGRSYGTQSPMMKAYAANGKILMLGVDYKSATYLHVVEVSWWNRALATDPKAEYQWVDREKVGETFWDRQAKIQRGNVGNADCRLFRIRDFVDDALQFVTEHPESGFKHWPAS